VLLTAVELDILPDCDDGADRRAWYPADRNEDVVEHLGGGRLTQPRVAYCTDDARSDFGGGQQPVRCILVIRVASTTYVSILTVGVTIAVDPFGSSGTVCPRALLPSKKKSHLSCRRIQSAVTREV